MDKTEKLQRMAKQARVNQAAVEAACSVPVVMRKSLGVLDPNGDRFLFDSSDNDGRIAVGMAASLDLAALGLCEFDSEASWFDVARVAISEFPPTLDDRSRVWVSDMGSLFHRYDDCQVMWDGKRTASEDGMTVHGVHSRTLADAVDGLGGFGYKLKPCKTCI